MTYQPTPLDAATDLKRCLFASYDEKPFASDTFTTFLNHSLVIIKHLEDSLDLHRLKIIRERLEKAQDLSADPQKRREDLLTAAVLLENAQWKPNL
ncbi:MAG: hypothetical protein Q8N84_02630 [bacterium]|nr:hypothetical protein [bacterium]